MRENKIYITVLWSVIITLLSVVLILILGMLNESIKYEYSAELFSAIGTFGGALAGAALAGYFSIRLFDKNIKHEEMKRNKEQDVKKLILLNDYLKESFSAMGFMRYLVDDYRKNAKKIKFPTPQDHDMEEELRIYNIAYGFFIRNSDQLIEEISSLNTNLNSLNFEAILDVEFRDIIRSHRFLLKEIKLMTEKIRSRDGLKKHLEVFEFQDIIANMSKYNETYHDFEVSLRESKI